MAIKTIWAWGSRRAAGLWLDFAFNDLQAEAVVGVHRAENLRPQEINLSRIEYLTVPDVSDEFVDELTDKLILANLSSLDLR